MTDLFATKNNLHELILFLRFLERIGLTGWHSWKAYGRYLQLLDKNDQPI